MGVIKGDTRSLDNGVSAFSIYIWRPPYARHPYIGRIGKKMEAAIQGLGLRVSQNSGYHFGGSLGRLAVTKLLGPGDRLQKRLQRTPTHLQYYYGLALPLAGYSCKSQAEGFASKVASIALCLLSPLPGYAEF